MSQADVKWEIMKLRRKKWQIENRYNLSVENKSLAVWWIDQEIESIITEHQIN